MKLRWESISIWGNYVSLLFFYLSLEPYDVTYVESAMIFLQMVRHGGCLGLGLAAMGSHRQDVYEQLKFNLYQDDAVTGEAAGIAMGMVMLGSKSTQAIEDMVAVSKN